MSMNEIPFGTYDVEIGESFSSTHDRLMDDASSGYFHTLKYDFKPKSVASEQETYISIAENNDVQVVVPNESMDHITVYKGPMKPIKGDKECVLIFDHNRNKVRMEKLSSNISLKKTRDNNMEDEDDVKEKIKEIRLRRRNAGKSRVENHAVQDQDPFADVQCVDNTKDVPAGKVREEGGRTDSFSGILAAELASSPSAHSSSSSSSSSSSDSGSSDSESPSSSDDEDCVKNKDKKEKSDMAAHESDDEHIQAIEKLMSESAPHTSGEQTVQADKIEKLPNNTSVVLNDLYMSDDNQSGSESD